MKRNSGDIGACSNWVSEYLNSKDVPVLSHLRHFHSNNLAGFYIDLTLGISVKNECCKGEFTFFL